MATENLVLEYIGIAATAFIAGFGGAAKYFSSYEEKVNVKVDALGKDVKDMMTQHKLDVHDRLQQLGERIDESECLANDFQDKLGDQQTKLAVVESCQENTALQLGQIQRVTGDTNLKLDGLIRTLLESSKKNV
jgi:hypothetical protein